MSAESAGKQAVNMTRYFLGLGSNLGNRELNLARAVCLLARTRGVEVHRRSSLYESAPVGPEQPDFLNAALEIETDLAPLKLLEVVKGIERELGRVPGGPRWGPRTLDIDLLLSDEIVAEPALQVPHLELHKRAFALIPLCELAPETVHPLLGCELRELLLSLADSQRVCRIGEFYVDP
jgi:2-amino-4-hydroxy-6-hydroxymethyldihydropteridine diphosphokinase